MLIKMSQLPALSSALSLIYQRRLTIPIAVRIDLNRFTKKVTEEASIYDEEYKLVINQYCQRDEEGNPITIGKNSVRIQEDKLVEFKEALETLLASEVNLPDFHFPTIPDIEDVPLSGEECDALMLLMPTPQAPIPATPV